MSSGEQPKRGTHQVYAIRAVERVCDILDLLQDAGSDVTLLDVATRSGLPKSSAFRYLSTLEARRYVEREPEGGTYRLGLAFLPFQLRQFDLLAQRARPRLEQLRDKFEETVNLGLLDGNRVTYLEILESLRAVRLAARRGDRDWIHSTALGKAITAHIPEQRVLDILATEGMPVLTPRTITDTDAYLAELARVRERGYAIDDCENEPDGRCIAVALTGTGLPVALSISAPASRLPLDRVEETADVLREVAGLLAADLTGTAQ